MSNGAEQPTLSQIYVGIIWGFPKIRGPLFGSPYHESPSILGSILGPLILGIPHMEAHRRGYQSQKGPSQLPCWECEKGPCGLDLLWVACGLSGPNSL